MATPKKTITKTTLRSAAAATPRPASERASVSSKVNAGQAWQRVARILRLQSTHIVLLLLLVVAASLFFYHQGQQSATHGQQPIGDVSTTAGVVQRVSRHILLPSGEQPTVATVTDASKVRSQAFFASAASGDKVLIYAQAKKAYLYRPSIDRVIEVAPLAPNSPTQPATPTEQPASQ